MKKMICVILMLVCALSLPGCNKKSMHYILQNEPSIVGVVEEVTEHSILLYCKEMEGYPGGARCWVSLDAENEDSYTDVSVGDEVVVYYSGDIAETDPLEISTVYAITLRTPANREKNSRK